MRTKNVNRVTSRSNKNTPAMRPLRLKSNSEIAALFKRAIGQRDGLSGAHCIHELWMRGEMAVNIERLLKELWAHCADSIPDWLPMRHIEWLPIAYEVATHFKGGRGTSNLYLVLLDYTDSRPEPYGVYVGMTKYLPHERFDQHKAGIRAAGSVLKRGLELLSGPVLHLQRIKRVDAERIEIEMAEALRAAGLFVQGGH